MPLRTHAYAPGRALSGGGGGGGRRRLLAGDAGVPGTR